MKDKKIIALIVLIIVAIISLSYGLAGSSKVKVKLSPEKSLSAQNINIQSNGLIIPSQRFAKRTNYASWGRSPFIPQKLSQGIYADLILGGILWDQERPMAIINDTVMKVGDKVGSNTIVDIKPDKVILNDGLNNLELKLK